MTLETLLSLLLSVRLIQIRNRFLRPIWIVIKRTGVSRRQLVQGAPSDAEAPMTRQLALEILGLTDAASEADIIRAHREMMRRLHPDRRIGLSG